MVILRCCYHQILGPCRHFPKLANGRCRHSDSGSASTRILPGKPPRAMWSAGMLLGLYCIRVPSLFVLGSFGPPAARGTRSGRTAEQRNEIAPCHSITSSAVDSRVGGIVRPSAAPPPVPPVGEAGDDDQPRPNALQWLCTINLPLRGAWDRPCVPRLTHCAATAMGKEGRVSAPDEPPACPVANRPALTEGYSTLRSSTTKVRFSAIFEVTLGGLRGTSGYKYGP